MFRVTVVTGVRLHYNTKQHKRKTKTKTRQDEARQDNTTQHNTRQDKEKIKIWAIDKDKKVR
jgi:hypothetical protein